ncbi:NUDIX hydrolase [Paenibacillus alkalitolerans]|uniref:NUDIX hydrolase n=1 Tax=Paenibacillus alkalitolerans TaxID=2799335 RepID=UPI0018F5FDF4|nr:NUDIX domain-containing protein [Paenibacillus alkalitolerans]
MPSEELFDVFDEQMAKIGVETRENVHSQGLWHQTFHCWIINNSTKGELKLLLQLRHKDKDTFPDLLDTSCAGHLLTGESAADGVRELQEELGLYVSINELHFCGTVAEESIISKDLIDREFNHVFIYECNLPLSKYNFQTSEISGLFFIGFKQFKHLLNGEVNAIPSEGIMFDEMNGVMANVRRDIVIDDFALYSIEYYDLLFNGIEKLYT